MELQQGQVAVITGGASGLGLALAEAFAARGLSIVLGDVERGPLDGAVAAFEARDVPVLGVPTDVRFPDQVDALAEATLARFGRVDVLCNNAGVATMSGPTWDVPLEDWAWVMGVNLNGVVHGIRSFVPHLIAQNSGHVVNTASMAGISSGPGMAPYLASKHAVAAVSDGLRAELADVAPGVGVTTVCPGSMATNIATAERNRPAECDRPGGVVDPTTLAPFMAWIDSISHEVMPAADAAAIVIAAVEGNRAHALPNASSVGTRAWIDQILVDLPAD